MTYQTLHVRKRVAREPGTVYAICGKQVLDIATTTNRHVISCSECARAVGADKVDTSYIDGLKKKIGRHFT